MTRLSLSDRILPSSSTPFQGSRKPPWLRAKLPGAGQYQRLRALIDEHQLHTVCESAKCPNLGECWARGTATLMILGNVCTRSCGFCHIATGRPGAVDTNEPYRVGQAAAVLRLGHLVITSVNRDELADGGAAIWAETIRQIRLQSPQTSIEVLIPDFCGDWNALQLVFDQRPEILNHNLETVPRLYSVVRPQAKYERSLDLLRRSKEQGLVTKTGIMVGIGECDEEIYELMHDLVGRTRVDRSTGPCDILTIGQYLQPTGDHLPIDRWVHPDQFDHYKRFGESIGLGHVESGPMVRSSYHAEDQVQQLRDSSDPLHGRYTER